MAYEQRDNSGSLFKNDKQGHDNRPDYRGNAMVNGEMLEMSAWIKTSQSGTKYMSVSFKEQYQKPEAPKPDRAGQWKAAAPKAPQHQYAPAEDDSDISF